MITVKIKDHICRRTGTIFVQTQLQLYRHVISRAPKRTHNLTSESEVRVDRENYAHVFCYSLLDLRNLIYVLGTLTFLYAVLFLGLDLIVIFCIT